MTEIPEDIKVEASAIANLIGVTPCSDMRIHVERAAGLALMGERRERERWANILRNQRKRLEDMHAFLVDWRDDSGKPDMGQMIGATSRGIAAIDDALGEPDSTN